MRASRPAPRASQQKILDGCPSHEALLPRLRRLLDEAGVRDEIELRRVESPDAAERERFLGSPTLRIDGRDVEAAAAQRTDYGLKCRLYPTGDGLRGTPPDHWIRDALQIHGGRGADA